MAGVSEKPPLKEAISIWRMDDAYKKINYMLDPDSYHKPECKDHPDITTHKNEINEYKISDIIQTLQNAMKPSDKEETFYRGGSEHSKQSYQKKTFISLSDSKEQATAFIDDSKCCLFCVTVHKDVKRLKTGIEYETLIEPNALWIYNESETKETMIPATKQKYTMYKIYIFPPDLKELPSTLEHLHIDIQKIRPYKRPKKVPKKAPDDTKKITTDHKKIQRMYDSLKEDEMLEYIKEKSEIINFVGSLLNEGEIDELWDMIDNKKGGQRRSKRRRRNRKLSKRRRNRTSRKIKRRYSKRRNKKHN